MTMQTAVVNIRPDGSALQLELEDGTAIRVPLTPEQHDDLVHRRTVSAEAEVRPSERNGPRSEHVGSGERWVTIAEIAAGFEASPMVVSNVVTGLGLREGAHFMPDQNIHGGSLTPAARKLVERELVSRGYARRE